MNRKYTRLALAGGILVFCLTLSGCDAQLDESILTAEANYDIDISLPYATVTPPPAFKEETEALVIDSEGGVTVNDASALLNSAAESSSESTGNYKSLRLGNTGLAVQALQNRLQELGYYTSGVSGIFDSDTEQAVRRFEQTYGTMQTGVATSELQTRLFASDALIYGSDAYNKAVIAQYKVLQRGDVGSSVYALQQRLKNLGYPIDELTGIFDNETANAVMLFYEAYGLTADDVANVAMQKELYSDSVRTYEGDGAQTSVVAELRSLADVQQRLIDLGYLSGEATGELDKRTEIAIKLFEEACGQLPSGSVTTELQAMLQSEYAPDFSTIGSQYSNLIEGASGEEVYALQNRLIALGFASGAPNGEYGSATTASIRLFQNRNGMDETGIASAYVQAVLNASFALNIDGETMQNLSAVAPEDTPVPEVAAADVQTAEAPAQDDGALLGVGSSSDAVLQLQNRLTELGYITSLTGNYDALTARAVSTVQTSLGLDPDGTVDESLLEFINSEAAPRSGMVYAREDLVYPTLRTGDTGDALDALQKRLRELNYLTKKQVSGTFDDATRAAIVEIQQQLSLTDDGEVCPALLSYLLSDASDVLEKDD